PCCGKGVRLLLPSCGPFYGWLRSNASCSTNALHLERFAMLCSSLRSVPRHDSDCASAWHFSRESHGLNSCVCLSLPGSTSGFASRAKTRDVSGPHSLPRFRG